MSFTVKKQVLAKNINDLSTKLETIRSNQDDRPDIDIEGNFEVELKSKSKATVTPVVSTLIGNLKTLETTIPEVTFSSSIEVPVIKSLLKAKLFEDIKTAIDNLEEICADCTTFSTGGGGGGCESDHTFDFHCCDTHSFDDNFHNCEWFDTH